MKFHKSVIIVDSDYKPKIDGIVYCWSGYNQSNGIMIEFDSERFFASLHIASASQKFSKGCRNDIDLIIKKLNG